MCGILFLATNKGQAASKAVRKRYQKQKARGTRGFGYVAINGNDVIEHLSRATTEEGIMTDLKTETGNTILFHHRTPTSTENFVETTHPFIISDPRHKYDYYIIHNGVINNWLPLYEEYKKDGYVFNSELHESTKISFPNIKDSEWEFDTKIKINDSEALSVDLARYFEGLQTEIKSRGSIAFIALKVDKETAALVQVIYGHNDGNPLRLEMDKTLFCLRSQGGGTEVPVNRIYFIDWKTKKTEYDEIAIGSYFKHPAYNGMGYDSRRLAPRTSSVLEELRKQGIVTTPKGVERMLSPDHPVLLPRTSDMNQTLEDMDAAFKRSADSSFDESESNREPFTGGPKDDERNSGPDDDVDYRQADFNDELNQQSFINARGDLEIEEIRAALSESESNSDEARVLRKELRMALWEAQQSAAQVSDAKALLRSIADDFQKDKENIETLEEANAMLHAAETHHKELLKEVNCITAELSTYN